MIPTTGEAVPAGKRSRSHLLVCKIFLKRPWVSWNVPTHLFWLGLLRTLTAAKLVQLFQEKREEPRQSPVSYPEVCTTYKPQNCLQGWSLWHCMKQSEYTEIKGLAVGLTSMQLHGFSLLWKKKIQSQRQSNYWLSFYIWEQEEHTELAWFYDALFVSWW